jgi:5'-deoxynucleotidase YfbR-like HD superfamily hydrolase
MKFGYLKTAIEKKLVNSFVNETLTNDLKTFKQLVLKSTPTKKLFFIYDKLNENLGMDKESASLLVDEIIKESKGITIPEKHFLKLSKWVNNDLKVSEYHNIDQILNTNLQKIEETVESKKLVIENLTKTKKIVKEGISKLPLSSVSKIMNSTANQYLNKLDESTKKEVLSIFKQDEKVLTENFKTEKKEVLKKLDEMINSSSEDELKTRLNETKERIKSTQFNFNEFVKIKELNKQLVL